jgi:hypothetical protein
MSDGLRQALKEAAAGIVADIEKMGGELVTEDRRRRAQRAAEMLAVYPFAVIGKSGEEKARLDERRELALSTLGNTALAITIESRAAVERIVRERVKQVMIILLNLAGIAIR